MSQRNDLGFSFLLYNDDKTEVLYKINDPYQVTFLIK